MTYEPGAWLRGTIYPQRCDLSLDGRFFVYFAMQASATWELGCMYVAISRLPWLTALAAWGTSGTWTRGCHFVPDADVLEVSEPEHGTVLRDRLRAGLALTRPASFAVERRRGWVESDDSPPRDPQDMWDERRALTLRMTKPQPGSSDVRLEVTGGYAAFRSRGYSDEVSYDVIAGGERLPLDALQWAEWAPDGNLLVATDAGRLEVREPSEWRGPGTVVADLATQQPQAVEPPASARRW